MTTRTITTNEAGQSGVATTNGAPTWTTSVWDLLTDIDYLSRPRGSGVNKELLSATLEAIQEHRQYWHQGSWRSVVTVRASHTDSLGLSPLVEANRCGTAMCFAGWAVELVKADWVVDGALLALASSRSAYGPAMDYERDEFGDATGDWVHQDRVLLTKDHLMPLNDAVFVRLDWWYPNETTPGRTRWGRVHGSNMAGYHSLVAESIAARGFSPETHEMVDVAEFGAAVLGIDGDPMSLFSGSNTLAVIKRIVEAYLLWGAKPTDQQVYWVRGTNKPLADFTERYSRYSSNLQGAF